MHDLTTLDLPSISDKKKERQELAEAVAQFLSSGAEIHHPEPVRAQLKPSHWRDRPARQNSIGRNRRELERKEKMLAERISALAAAGLSPVAIRKRVGLGPVAFGQLAARHQINLENDL